MNIPVLIGIELHARLNTRAKLFCRCANDATLPPNSAVCPVCLGLPGTLPALNEGALRKAMLVGHALNARIHSESYFCRKNYHYPDLPKGYQITQYPDALCTEGRLEFTGENGSGQQLRILRVHVEEDAAKLLHGRDEVLVDFNRSGVPLVEIVSAPELHTPEDAVAAVRELRRLLIWLDVCDGAMEMGSLRCDVNVSLDIGDPYNGKTEIKNLNSFAAIDRALRWEIDRLAASSPHRGSVESITLHWDDALGSGTVMRGKEGIGDYRYVREPDLPALRIDDAEVHRVRDMLPELPRARAARFHIEYGVPPRDCTVLCEQRAVAEYFEDVLHHARHRQPLMARQACAWITGELRHAQRERAMPETAFPIAAQRLANLLDLLHDECVSSTAARHVLNYMMEHGTDAETALEFLHLRQISDEAIIDEYIRDVLRTHASQARAAAGGDARLLPFLMGNLLRAGAQRLHPGKCAERLRLALAALAQEGE
ncbi:MAG TPA: Asp-tRNA(Asn)/Glu-tRNA(Gln) amidotransferase subunit GatB [Bacteroidota bacterium]|nr:Asp-tRNA(Asn)/Glu-tRNA(Gln) amidotransferase subunit GatB [Bacteroidota bacterium]